MGYKAPRGTRDVMFEEAARWRYLVEEFRKLCQLYGFEEIITPIFEESQLFIRSVGEESDVVKKEMYLFHDRSKRKRELALRPEGTAAVARAYIEHGLYNAVQPVKLFYFGPMFRYDRPQAGRQRQFFQFGLECFGSQDPATDVEIIKLTADFFSRLGLKGVKLHLNSVGCRNCRPSYQKVLNDFAAAKSALLCPDCRRRVITNPLRLLDCKENSCRAIMKEAPQMHTCLCSSCYEQLQEVQELLESLNIPYFFDPYLVRGLDYYTNTAFEFISDYLGAQGSLGGGGRYDNLVEICGGPPTPGVGMAAGIERILLAMEQEGIKPKKEAVIGTFLAIEAPELKKDAFRLLYLLRDKGIKADIDYQNRSLKAQMKYAGRKKFRYVIILEKENKNKVLLRDMESGEQQELSETDLINFLLY
ncbi:MAG: histidine--tRNA ligase [Dethiobacteria bacterium]|jgi:histidyl-tRNA synthetase